jgi:hypothetical protein
MFKFSPIIEKEVRSFGSPLFCPLCKKELAIRNGQWIGKGAQLLGLQNPPRGDQFNNLLAGRSPDGATNLMRQETSNPMRNIGWWWPFCPPAGFGATWVNIPDGCREPFRRVQAEAVTSALGAFEAYLGARHAGQSPDQQAMPLLAAFLFEPQGPRQGSPHTGAFFINLGIRSDGRIERFAWEDVLPLQDKVNDHYQSALQQAIARDIGPQLSLSSAHEKSFAASSRADRFFRDYVKSIQEAQNPLGPWQQNGPDSLVRIRPIQASDGNKLYQEFFTAGSAAQRCGLDGLWTGRAAENLPLRNPVQLQPFENLLSGHAGNSVQRLPPESDNNGRVLGWRLDIDTSRSLSTLWALAPRAARLVIERGHMWSVGRALGELELGLGRGGEKQEGRLASEPAMLFAKFRSGVESSNHDPHLHTTVFLFNFGIHENGTTQIFSNETVLGCRRRMEEVVQGVLDMSIVRNLGAFKQEVGRDRHIVGLPRDLWPNVNSGLDRRQTASLGANPPAVARAQQFSKWQEQAVRSGWGPKQAAAFLRLAKWKMTVEKIQKAWQAWDENLQRSIKDMANFATSLGTKRIETKENTPPRSQVQPSKDKDRGMSH